MVPPLCDKAKMSMRGVDVFYGDKQAIFDVNLDIGENQVIAMIGPSGCGKSTFLRSLNRMNDTVESCRVSGSLMLEEQDIYSPKIDIVALRGACRHGLPEAKPFPQVHLRQYCLWPAHSWPGVTQN